MTAYRTILLSLGILLSLCPRLWGQEGQEAQDAPTLWEVVEVLTLQSPQAQREFLAYQNKVLEYENYRKGFLPSASLTLNPLSFNRSLRLLQKPEDGTYAYVEDNANTGRSELTLTQKVGFTGGDLRMGADFSLLSEFAPRNHSFSTSPFSISYSQKLFGNRKVLQLEKRIRSKEDRAARQQCCANLAQIQLRSADLYLSALTSRLAWTQAEENQKTQDTLLQVGTALLQGGHITPFDLKQIELQDLETQYACQEAAWQYEKALRELQLHLNSSFPIQHIAPHSHLLFPPLDPNAVRHRCLQNNPFHLEQEIKLLEAERALSSAKTESRLNGDLSLNYGMYRYAESFSHAPRRGNTQQSVTLGFRIPLWDWGTQKNKRRIAQNTYDAGMLEIQNNAQRFEHELLIQTQSYLHACHLQEVAQTAYQLACQQYSLAIQRFTLGETGVHELTAAKQKQGEALLRYSEALKETAMGYFRLRALTLHDFVKERDLENLFFPETHIPQPPL